MSIIGGGAGDGGFSGRFKIRFGTLRCDCDARCTVLRRHGAHRFEHSKAGLHLEICGNVISDVGLDHSEIRHISAL